MYSETKGFVKSISAGLVTGLAIASASSKAMKSDRRLERTAGKTMCKVNGVPNNTEYMFE